jgi:hypothetical protein
MAMPSLAIRCLTSAGSSGLISRDAAPISTIPSAADLTPTLEPPPCMVTVTPG